MLRVLALLILMASPVWAVDTTITIPDAFLALGKDTELCGYYAAKQSNDGAMTRKKCLEELLREKLIELALEKLAADLKQTVRDQQRTESRTIVDSWPTGVDQAICGDNELDGAEVCDGTADVACPGLCQSDCTCP